jgi:RNA-directed DNA polymerase
MEITIHHEKVVRKQQQLHYKAVREPELKFTALYGLLAWEPWGEVALRRVLTNPGAKTPGVDDITKDDLKTESKRKALLAEGRYAPQPARRVYIPKANGKMRPLGIPTIQDRVVQAMVLNVLEPIFEADFEECSYGFRPNRCCWDALADIGQYLKRPSNYEWVVEGDIRDCFGSVNHKVLLRQLRRRIRDERLLDLIWKMLKAGVMEDLRYYSTEDGTPQGGIVSPLLANIYMHQLDEWAAQHSHRLTRSQRQYKRARGWATIRLVRYADDFVILVKGTREQAEEIKAQVAELLETKMKMDLSREKTHITHRTEGFTFLGIEVKYDQPHKYKNVNADRGCVYYSPSPKAIKRYKEKIRELIGRAYYFKDVEVIRAINRLNIGWAGYYRHANSARLFTKLDNWVWHVVFRWLTRKHQMSKKAAYKRFRVRPETPINKHPTRKDHRLGAWDGKGNFLAIWPLSFTSIRYWMYQGNRIPQKYRSKTSDRLFLQQPKYAVTAWMEGQNLRDTAEYRNLKEIVKERDRYKCQECGRYAPGAKGHVHHTDGDLTNDNLSNLTLLCEDCHKETHSYGGKKRTIWKAEMR